MHDDLIFLMQIYGMFENYRDILTSRFKVSNLNCEIVIV